MDHLVANLLNQYLGKYVLNLASENLNVGIFSGEVELKDLQLRPEALFELQLPVEVKAGVVGRIHLTIPWTSLYTSSVTVVLEDVYILVSPIADRKYDAAKDATQRNAIKQQILAKLENPQDQKKDGSSVEDQGFVEKLMATVINNIQISVHHIHIRYEDVTNRQHPFSCGIMLKKLTAETTTDQWKPTQINGSATRIHKLVQLEGLSCYWNPYLHEQSMVRNQIHTSIWRNLLKNSIDTHTIKEQELDFIIRPVSASCKMVLNKDSLSVMPRVMVDIEVDDIEVLVSRLQFLNMLSLMDSLRMMAVNQRYRKYNPGQPVSANAPAWWKYAYTAIVEETIRPWSWDRIKRVRQRYRQYKNVYKQHLKQPNNETLMNQLRHLEDDLDITNILVAREHAKLELAQEDPDLAHKKKVKRGWWAQLWDGEDEVEEMVIHTPTASSRLSWLDHLTPQEREKLYNAVGYDENENIEHIPQYVAHKFTLCLTSCSVSLVNYGKEVLKVSVTNLITSLENRPDSGGFGVSAKTESFVVEGVSIERELIPLITSDIGVYAPSKVTQVFSVEFEKRPLQLEADFAIRMNVQPVEMVYDEHAVTEVIAFFQVPSVRLKDMKKIAQAGLERFTSISRAGLQYAIQQHKTVHVSVNMRSPYVVIPEYGTLHRGGNVLVVDFGKLKVESELQPKNVSLQECTLSEVESRLYDKFNITITEVKALLADSAEDWHTAQTKPDSEYHVLPSVGMHLAFFNTVKNDYTRLPQQKVEARLPTLKVNLSDEKIQMFANFFKRLPVPHSSSMMGLEDMVDGGAALEPLTAIMDEAEVQREPSLQELAYMRHSVLRNSVLRHDATVRRKKKVHLSVRTSDSEYFSASDHSDEEGGEWARNITALTVDDQTSATNVIRLLARFTLGEVLVQVSKSADRIDTPYLMFRVNRLCADAALTTYGLALQASLGGIELVDKIHLSSSGEYLEVLSSKSESDLISVIYRKVEPDCPDFENVYGRVEQTMLVQMSSLHMMFDRAALLYLNTFIQGLLLSVRGGMDRGMQKSTSTVLSVQVEQSQPDSPSLLQRISSQVEEDPITGVTQLHLVAKLDDLEMKLCDHENDFAEIKARGFEGTVIKKPSKVTFHVKLSDFSIDDLTENTLYPRLLVIEDDEVFDLKFVSYTKPTLKTDAISKKRTAVDMSLRLRIGRLQGTLLYKFISEIKNFLDPFMNPEVTKAYKVAAQKAINDKIQDVQEQGTRIRLTVDIKAPSVHVPQNSESTSVIVLKLGDLHVTNSFEDSEVGGITQKWDHLYLKLQAVKVIRGKLNMNGYIEHVHTVVDPTNLRLDLKRALPPIQTDCTHDFSGHLHMIKVQVTQLDLKVVMAILHENFSETSNKPAIVDDVDLSPQLTDDHVLVTQDSTDTQMPCLESVEPLLATPDASEIIKQTRFMFVMDGTQLRLLQEDDDPLVMTSPGQEEGDGLAQFETGKLDLSGQWNNDGSLEVDLCLKSVSLDDVREHSNLAVKRLIQSSNHVRSKYDTAPPMFHIKYKQDAENNRYIDVNLEMVRVNLCVAYLMSIAHFLTNALQVPKDMTRSKVKAQMARLSVRSQPPGGSTPQNGVRPALTVSGRFKKPEIVLFAEPDVVHSRVLILKACGVFDYSCHQGRTQTEAKVKQLQMFSGYYGLAQQTASMVLHPCDLEFTQSQEAPEAELKVTLMISDISLHMSATTLHIFFDVMDILNEDRKMELSTSDAVASMNAEYFDLWTTNNISSQKWLSMEDESDHGPKYPVWPVGAAVQTLTVAVKQVHVLFEVENKDYQVPRLSIRAGLTATVHDWSKQMRGEVCVSVDVSCYNDQLAVWEPVLEPIMKQEDEYKPWELVVKFVQAESLPISCEFDSVEAGKQDDIDGDIHYLLCRARATSDSSEMETDSDNEMTLIQSKRNRQSSDRSHEIQEEDVVDGPGEKKVAEMCTYILIDSRDDLSISLTPHAIDVITTVSKTLLKSDDTLLRSIHDLPGFEVYNRLGIGAMISLSPQLKVTYYDF